MVNFPGKQHILPRPKGPRPNPAPQPPSVPSGYPRNPDPYHFAKMLDEELRRVQEGSATDTSIARARNTWAEGAAAIAAGEYAGERW